MVNSGETARLSCNVQASITIITLIVVGVTIIVVIIIGVTIMRNHQDSAEKHSVIWRNAAGDEVEEEGRWVS